MGAPIIQTNYDTLAQIAGRFGQAAERCAGLQQQVRGAYNPLADGGWLGRGAASFTSEMESVLFPALQRFQAALDAAREVTIEVRARLLEAEREAAAPFQGQAESGDWDETPIFSLDQAPPPGPSGTATAISIGLDVTPGVGEVKGLVEVFTGRDLITGEELGLWRFAGLLGLVGLNEAKLLRHGDEALAILKRSDEAVDLARREGRVFSELAPGGGLIAHEARGGHIIARHIGKTDEELLARLASQPKIKGASTFVDRATTEAVASRTLREHQNTIRDWIENSTAPTLKLTYTGDGTTVIGRGVMRNGPGPQPMYNADIFLRRDASGGFILTGYPRP